MPPTILATLAVFAPLSSRRGWAHGQVLLAGARLTPTRRPVAAARRGVGLAESKRFHRYHRVLSRARWSGLAVSRTLPRSLIATFVPDGPRVVGVDETRERRRGATIAAEGIDRDPVRSRHAPSVEARGRRWVCLMLLVPLPGAARPWALPVLTALAPAERYARTHRRRHQTLPEWAWHLLAVVRRWWPDRPLVAVAASTYATLLLLARCRWLSGPKARADRPWPPSPLPRPPPGLGSVLKRGATG